VIPLLIGRIGVFTQLAIVLGIFLTQLIGLYLATSSTWRLVLFFSFVIAVAQLFASGMMVDTPGYTMGRGGASAKEEGARLERMIWGASPSTMESGM
jgi:MFS transporter, SP family, solute carrier family 2 (facilitated glucose transporter), member 3